MQSSQDQIPPPQPSGPDTSPAPQQQAPSENTVPSISIPFPVNQIERRGLGGNDIIIGVGVSLVLAAIFWFVGRILTDTLVKQFAEVGAAKRAGVMLFLLLTVLGVFGTFGFLGNLWLATYFLVPAASLSTLMFFVFVFSFVAANRTKRR
jgi:hypothetical protein